MRLMNHHLVSKSTGLSMLRLLLILPLVTLLIWSTDTSISYVHTFRIQLPPTTKTSIHQHEHTSRCMHHYRNLISLYATNNKKQQGTNDEATTDTSSNIYSMPALYDIAFGYRNYEDEVEFLLSKHVEINHNDGGTRPQKILEIAAGPARHSITALLLPLLDSVVVVDDNNDDNNNIDIDVTAMMNIPTVYCIDTSTEMATYARQVLQDEMENYMIPSQYKEQIQERFHYQIADMKQFILERERNDNNNDDNNSKLRDIDTVWILLGSLQHMITNDDVIQCFQCIQNVLHDRGTIFLELPHPRESTFNIMDCTRNGWKVPLQQQERGDGNLQDDRLVNDDDDDDYDDDEMDDNGNVPDGGELSIVWGDDGDAFDPITQVRQFSIRFDLSGVLQDDDDNQMNKNLGNINATTTSIEQVVPMRLFTAQEIDALARCAGLEVVAMYGALEDGVDVNDEEASYRLVSVLRKQSR